MDSFAPEMDWMEEIMRSEQTVLIVGCQPSIERILSASLQRQGYRVLISDFFDILPFEKTPHCLLINLEENQCIQARKFLEQPALAYCKRILIIDSHSSRLRQWSIDIPVDDVIFKPVRLRELLTRVKLILEREVTLPGQETTVDELDFAQRMQTLTDERFTGLVHFAAKHVDADLFFVRGTIAGVRVGKKIQKTAIGALWRVFPAVHHIKPKVRLPDWALENPLDCDQNQFIAIVVRTGGFFHDIFGDNRQLQVIYRINSLEYERVYRDLPRQVRQIIQHFDGERTFEEIMDTLNLDEMLLMQIVRRLLDESLIVECSHAREDQDVPLKAWIQSGASSAEIKRALTSPQNVETPDTVLDERTSFSSVYPLQKQVYEPGEEATPSAVFFLQNSPYIGANTQKRARAKQKTSEDKPRETTKNNSKQARVQAQKEAILADFSQRMGISQREIQITPHASGEFCATPCEYKHYSRADVEKHLAEAKEPLLTANCRIQKDRIYSEEELEAEALHDEEMARLQQAEDEAVLNLSIDDSEISEALAVEGSDEPLVPDDDYDDESEEDSGEEEFSAVELYKNNPDHKYELSPEAWKAQIMKRLHADEQARDEKVMHILIYVLIVVIIALVGIILYKNIR